MSAGNSKTKEDLFTVEIITAKVSGKTSLTLSSFLEGKANLKKELCWSRNTKHIFEEEFLTKIREVCAHDSSEYKLEKIVNNVIVFSSILPKNVHKLCLYLNLQRKGSHHKSHVNIIGLTSVDFENNLQQTRSFLQYMCENVCEKILETENLMSVTIDNLTIKFLPKEEKYVDLSHLHDSINTKNSEFCSKLNYENFCGLTIKSIHCKEAGTLNLFSNCKAMLLACKSMRHIDFWKTFFTKYL